MYLHKGQELRFSHYILCFKNAAFKGNWVDSRWRMTDEDQVKELYIAQEKLNYLNFTMSVEGMGEKLMSS